MTEEKIARIGVTVNMPSGRTDLLIQIEHKALPGHYPDAPDKREYSTTVRYFIDGIEVEPEEYMIVVETFKLVATRASAGLPPVKS